MKSNEMEKQLYQTASLQQGFFTSRQAKEAGYADSRFAYHVKRGRWVREGRGIYRLAYYPAADRPDLVYWSLWSCNRSGEVQGVFSHQTALYIHDLSDIAPVSYHMTVPQGFRRFNKPPENLVLHFADVPVDQSWEFEGYRVTSPERTIRDALLDENIPDEVVIDAISQEQQFAEELRAMTLGREEGGDVSDEGVFGDLLSGDEGLAEFGLSLD